MNASKLLVARLGITNDTTRPRIVWVEPYGEDYTLLPKQELDIIAVHPEGLPWFHVAEHDDSTRVYIENFNDYDVLQLGEIIECGHRRQDALDAGLKI